MAGAVSRENGKKGGRPKGSLGPAGIEKAAAREAFRQQVLAALSPMTEAQIAHSQGVYYMVLRRPDGSWVRATDEAQIDAGLAAGGELCRIYRQAPNHQAFAYLVDQALDKAPQSLQVTGEDGGPVVFRWQK